jgi:hypothetical protein
MTGQMPRIALVPGITKGTTSRRPECEVHQPIGNFPNIDRLDLEILWHWHYPEARHRLRAAVDVFEELSRAFRVQGRPQSTTARSALSLSWK